MEKFKKQLIILVCWFFSLNLFLGSFYLLFYKKIFSVPLFFLSFLFGFFVLFFCFTILNIVFESGLLIFKQKIKNLNIFRPVLFFISLFFIFPWFGFSAWTLLLFVFLFSGFYFGSKRIEKVLAHEVKFSFFKILEAGKSFFINSIAFLVAFLIFLSPKILDGKIFLPRNVYNFFFPELEKAFSNKYPGFSGEMNIDEFVFLMVIQNPPENFPLKESGKDIKSYFQLKEILKKFKQKLGEKNANIFLKQARFQVFKNFGFSENEIKNIKGDEKLNEFLYNIISKEIESKSKTYQYFLGGVFGIIFFSFLIIKFLLAILSLIFVPLFLAMFSFLEKINFFEINLVKIDKEEIRI